uniref:Putative interferon-binding protein n=1 Tax=Renibacterium salmoninarum TaxID=1646 RepID=Q8KHY9_RENSA|nr:putative interferon-binding protein [Renibacterium salmoninarum]AAM47184.1 putative interferon-binding protein [Renibacterium salmoninarum]
MIDAGTAVAAVQSASIASIPNAFAGMPSGPKSKNVSLKSS